MEKEYTFILPYLNEEKTLEYCIKEIQKTIEEKNLDAEILVSDNGSTDNSVKIAEKNGVRVVICKEKGYGAALINGTNNAKGKYCIMGDSDGSYDFYNIDDFIKKLKEGYELVVGNRFKGGIEKGAMSISHKLGVRFLSNIANLIFHTPVKDYHCGLRAYETERLKKLKLSQKGMEYASEMIRDRKSHLKTIRDGWKHLKLIFKLAINKKQYIIEETKND